MVDCNQNMGEIVVDHPDKVWKSDNHVKICKENALICIFNIKKKQTFFYYENLLVKCLKKYRIFLLVLWNFYGET